MTITARLDDDAVPTLVLSGKGARPQRVTLTGRRAEIAAMSFHFSYRSRTS